MISKKDFERAINELPKKIPSKSGKAFYSGFKLVGNILHFYREIPHTNWKLDIDVLYFIYSKNKFINTSIIKAITKGRVNSPSVAILIAIGCLDIEGNRL